jgi:transcription antitermination factor NusG
MAWYAVHTRSRHEGKVHLGLTQKSIHTFLPLIEVWSRRKDRRKRIQLPMFPGYLFVELPVVDNAVRLEILKTFGVVKILGRPRGADPIPVPDEKIETIKRLIESKVEIQHYSYPKVGEGARITDGPFRGIEGTVIRTDLKKDLFVISIDMLQRSVAIEIKGFQIEKI